MNLFNIANAFERNKLRGWPKVYWAIDIHDTIGKGTYKKNNEGLVFYPWAHEVLKNLSNNSEMEIVLYTASHMEPARAVQAWLSANDVNVLAINDNPHHTNTELCDFSKKFYFDILLDDKAGFEGWRDWFLIMKELQRLGKWTYSKSHEEKMRIVHAVWLAAGEGKCDVHEVTMIAASFLKLDPKTLFESFDHDYMDRAWCSRPVDWKPEDSLAYLHGKKI